MIQHWVVCCYWHFCRIAYHPRDWIMPELRTNISLWFPCAFSQATHYGGKTYTLREPGRLRNYKLCAESDIWTPLIFLILVKVTNRWCTKTNNILHQKVLRSISDKELEFSSSHKKLERKTKIIHRLCITSISRWLLTGQCGSPSDSWWPSEDLLGIEHNISNK